MTEDESKEKKNIVTQPEMPDLLDSDGNVIDNKKEEIEDGDLRKLLEFTLNKKNVSDEELERIKNDEDELTRLLRISLVKSKAFTYAPKKDFGATYKKKRKLRNRMAKQSRQNNR